MGAGVDDAVADDSPRFLARLRHGDPVAFEALVIAYQHRVFGTALRMLGSAAEAQEVAQEAFLRAHGALAGFRGDSKLGTWLYAITARLCLTRLGRSERRLTRHDEEALTRFPDGQAGPADQLERDEVERAVRRAIGALLEERRIVVILRDLEGLAYEEIAEVLDVPIGTVRSRLSRARQELRAHLEGFRP